MSVEQQEDYLITSNEQLEAVIGKADDFVAGKVFDHIDPVAKEFIGLSPLVMVATMDSQGRMDVSPKGDAPGFVHVEDAQLLIPDRPGNKLVYGFRNILQTGRIGLIFLVPGVRETLRVNGRASISRDPEWLERFAVRGKPALLCTHVQVEECFMHCGKAVIRSKLWQPDTWKGEGGGLMRKQVMHKLQSDDANLEKIISDETEKNYRDELY